MKLCGIPGNAYLPLFTLLCANQIHALQPQPGACFARVIDSGAALSVAVVMPNTSSSRFIQGVSPEYVIFSAGHKFQHPRATTAGRYLTSAVKKEKMFRTDRGNDEGANEWDNERISGHTDPSGDDDVDILIRPMGRFWSSAGIVDFEVRTSH